MAILPRVGDTWINLADGQDVKIQSVQQLHPQKHCQVLFQSPKGYASTASIENFMLRFRLVNRAVRVPCGDHINMESCGLCGWEREYTTPDPTERCPYSHEFPAKYCTQCGWSFEPPSSGVAIDGEKLARVVRDALPYEVQSWGANEKPEWRYRGTEDVDRHVRAITEALIRCQAEWLRSAQ